jgi:hypothetical protein
MIKHFLGGAIIGLALLGTFSGCGEGGGRITLDSRPDNVKVSLALPPEWALEGPMESGVAFFSEKENAENRGTVTIWVGEELDLEKWVDDHLSQMARMQAGAETMGQVAEQFFGEEAGELAEESFGWRLVSRTPTKVGSWEAVEIVEELSGKMALTLFVKKEKRVCQVSFFCFPEEWETQEPLFRKSLGSLKIR